MIENQKTFGSYFHLKVSMSVIYFLGTWPPRGKYRFLYTFYTICNFSLLLGIFLTTEIMNLLVNRRDTVKMLAGAALLMTNSTHASKVILLLRRQARIQALLDIVSSPVFNQDDMAHQDTLKSYARKGIFHHMAYQSFGIITVFCWFITPITDLMANRPRRLPIEGWYPYNVTVTPAFEITSIHQVITIIVASFHNVAIDTLITGLITVACCQLAILERDIISINNRRNIDDKDKLRISKREKHSYEKLKRCAVHNDIIYHFTTEIEDIFGIVIFLQFLSNCVIICLIAFNASQMRVYIPTVLIGMLTYICCMIYQIFIYCWHGNELYLHSMRIFTAAYSSNWFSDTERFKRSLQIVMARAHRPFTLSAGNIMLLSLDTFVQVCNLLNIPKPSVHILMTVYLDGKLSQQYIFDMKYHNRN